MLKSPSFILDFPGKVLTHINRVLFEAFAFYGALSEGVDCFYYLKLTHFSN